MKPIYLDHAAATPLDPQVFAAMQPYMAEQFYNPSSLYRASKEVRLAIGAARSGVADILGAKKSEIIFTAGGTESVNLAVFGVLGTFPGANFVTTNIEHDAVLACIGPLGAAAHPVKVVAVKPDGIVDVAQIARSIDDQTALVSVMYANNEIGTIQPIAEIARTISKVRSDRIKRGIDLPIYFHTDACQAGGLLNLHVSRLGVDLLTLNGSKIYGPKQTGCLYVRTGTQLQPLIYGGGQERMLRSGTENVPGIIGFAKALELAQADRQVETKRLTALSDQLLSDLRTAISDIRLNGHSERRLANNINITIPGIDGEMAVLYLDREGIMASTGSACSTGNTDPSHVLLAIGLDQAQARASLRFTLGKETTKAQLDHLVEVLPQLTGRLRELARNNY